MNLSGSHYCWLLVAITGCLGLSAAATAASGGQSGATSCEDKSSCLSLELDQWFAKLSDKKYEPECELTDEGEAAGGEQAKAFYSIVDCNSPNAIWQYKYAGAKGKRRIPHGKGKLSFSRLGNPPHGYDYGMKAGICFSFGTPSDSLPIKTIEANFVQGIPNGDAEITYFDGKATRGEVIQGVLHGFVRQYETALNKETNLELPGMNKRLYSIVHYFHGVAKGPEWILREDDTKLLHMGGETSDGSTLAIVHVGNETQYLVGTLEEEDMMTSVRAARLVGLEERYCSKFVRVEPYGERFDFDLQIKSRMKKTVAKLIRFFETVTDSKASLQDQFAAHPEPIEAKEAQHLLKVIRKDKRNLLVQTPSGEARVRFDGLFNEAGQPQGSGQLLFLSEFRRRDLWKGSSNETGAVDAGETNDDEDEDEDEEDADARRERERKQEEEKAGKSGQELSEFMDDYVPVEMLPFRRRDAKRVRSITGRFENGALQGLVKVWRLDGSALEGFCVDGVLHGVVREVDTPIKHGKRKRYVSRHVENVLIGGGILSKQDPISEVLFFGAYRNGYIDGPGWKFLVGGTFLYGSFKRSTTFTTSHGAFINQDLETAYVGRFVDGKMMAGQIGKVIGQRTEQGLKVPEFSELGEEVFRYVVPEPGQLVDPLVTDVTEDLLVEVKPSRLPGDSGDGLFAKVDIPDNTVFAFFGGERHDAYAWNSTKPFDPEYWMKVDDTAEIIHLPDEIGRDINRYRATLGHKINHSFSKWNCMFHNLDHPRFGLIPAARTTEKVTAGAELLCMYQMEYDQASPWYQELYRREIDKDYIYGPFGHRGAKHNESEPILPMLANSTLYKEFYKHAVEVLKLDPNTL